MVTEIIISSAESASYGLIQKLIGELEHQKRLNITNEQCVEFGDIKSGFGMKKEESHAQKYRSARDFVRNLTPLIDLATFRCCNINTQFAKDLIERRLYSRNINAINDGFRQIFPAKGQGNAIVLFRNIKDEKMPLSRGSIFRNRLSAKKKREKVFETENKKEKKNFRQKDSASNGDVADGGIDQEDLEALLILESDIRKREYALNVKKTMSFGREKKLQREEDALFEKEKSLSPECKDQVDEGRNETLTWRKALVDIKQSYIGHRIQVDLYWDKMSELVRALKLDNRLIVAKVNEEVSAWGKLVVLDCSFRYMMEICLDGKITKLTDRGTEFKSSITVSIHFSEISPGENGQWMTTVQSLFDKQE